MPDNSSEQPRRRRDHQPQNPTPPAEEIREQRDFALYPDLVEFGGGRPSPDDDKIRPGPINRNDDPSIIETREAAMEAQKFSGLEEALEPPPPPPPPPPSNSENDKD